jgi:hypothetical protein
MPTEEQATKFTLGSVFLGLMAAFSARLARRGESLQLRPFDLLLLGLTTYRTGRMIAFERVAEPLRQPFTETVKDGTGVGETVVASGHGVRWVFGELLSCPICIGTWVSAGLVYGLNLAPTPTRVFMAAMSATGIAQLLSDASEAMSWSGRAARKESGPERHVYIRTEGPAPHDIVDAKQVTS